MRVIVTGSRDWTDRDAVQAALQDVVLEHGRFTLAHGGCPRGADAIADRWGRAAEIPVEVFHADWNGLGRRAGPARNERMVKAGADLVLAFPLPESRGTRHAIALARAAGIPVRIWGEEEA